MALNRNPHRRFGKG